MKKFLLSLIALLGVVSANAQELSIADVEVAPGSQATFAIVLKNETSVRFRDSEFHFTFPAGISPLSATSGDQNIEPGTNLVGDDYRITVVAMSDTQSQGVAGNFTVCYVTIEAEAGLAEGTYTATLTKGEMAGNGDLIPGTSNYEVVKKNFENITFNIIVSKTVTLDENSTSAPAAAENVTVIVKRTIKAGQWSTICLPFTMTGDQVKAAFGEDVELADFNDYDLIEEGRDIVGVTVKFTPVESSNGLAANHPCIIKVSSPISQFKVENVTVAPAADEDLEINFNTPRRPHSIIGTYKAETVIPELALYLSNNKFYYSTGKTKTKAFRAYFNFDDILTDVEDEFGVKFSIFDGTDKINDLRFVETAGAVYTVDGKFIGRDVDLKKLQKGIYVIDGKKVAIK
jgi:hypothetical protein